MFCPPDGFGPSYPNLQFDRTAGKLREAEVGLACGQSVPVVRHGRYIAKLAAQRSIVSNSENRDQVRFRFVTLEDLHRDDMAEFLSEHLAAVRGVAAEATAS